MPAKSDERDGNPLRHALKSREPGERQRTQRSKDRRPLAGSVPPVSDGAFAASLLAFPGVCVWKHRYAIDKQTWSLFAQLHVSARRHGQPVGGDRAAAISSTISAEGPRPIPTATECPTHGKLCTNSTRRTPNDGAQILDERLDLAGGISSTVSLPAPTSPCPRAIYPTPPTVSSTAALKRASPAGVRERAASANTPASPRDTGQRLHGGLPPESRPPRLPPATRHQRPHLRMAEGSYHAEKTLASRPTLPIETPTSSAISKSAVARRTEGAEDQPVAQSSGCGLDSLGNTAFDPDFDIDDGGLPAR